MKGHHLCPRCGISTHSRGGKKTLCADCRHTPANPHYVWTRARTETRRLTRHPDPSLAAPVDWQVRGGIRYWTIQEAS